MSKINFDSSSRTSITEVRDALLKPKIVTKLQDSSVCCTVAQRYVERALIHYSGPPTYHPSNRGSILDLDSQAKNLGGLSADHFLFVILTNQLLVALRSLQSECTKLQFTLFRVVSSNEHIHKFDFKNTIIFRKEMRNIWETLKKIEKSQFLFNQL